MNKQKTNLQFTFHVNIEYDLPIIRLELRCSQTMYDTQSLEFFVIYTTSRSVPTISAQADMIVIPLFGKIGKITTLHFSTWMCVCALSGDQLVNLQLALSAYIERSHVFRYVCLNILFACVILVRVSVVGLMRFHRQLIPNFVISQIWSDPHLR